ncbi:MAG: ribosomal RNA small subunit methyltransferase A [Deltaproteobacteria bacterium]|nr:ribosomal RNA small subunit methyltransferase A [Deltaproteobacteria bacterium]
MSFVDPRVVLARHGLRPKHSFGQNFLVASAIVEKIAALCAERPGARVVEIGAGLGTLTSALLGRGAHVVAIERDRELLPVLREELAGDLARGALELVEADAASVDLDALLGEGLGERLGDGERVVAGNLPYQITGRLLEMTIPVAPRITRAVFMVQKEVADRLIAPPAGEAYGQLTVFVQASFAVERALIVRAGCFHPAPRVDSAVVVLRPLVSPRAIETDAFRKVVHAAFGARRKTLRNALAGLAQAPEKRAALEATGIDLGRRGETLSVEEFAALARAIE